MSDIKSYSEAFEELRTIVLEMEQGDISVDELSQKVKRASELIRFCKARLSSTEEDVNAILRDLNKDSA